MHRIKVNPIQESASRRVNSPISPRGRRTTSASLKAGDLPTIHVPRTELPALQAVVERSGRDSDHSLRLYLREAGETPLLTPQEEIALAKRIRCGDAAAREQMIKANLRLVVKIARDYDNLGMPLLDLINEGNMGLMKAVERFDPNRGAKLSTYAAWWIKQSVKRALANQGKTIRLPVHLVDLLARMRRAAVVLHEELGRDPTDLELAHALGMKRARVTELWEASRRPASLDASIGEDEDDTRLGELVPDEQMTTAYEQLDKGATHSMVREFIERLDKRETVILRYRFGLDGGAERTLEEVGSYFGVTRERIRQIQNVALSKLRKLIEKRERVTDPQFQLPWTHKELGA
ncbi:MAG: RNA polymerase sigma factor RpoD/SigA [Pedosphaera sp.]|nr:RNA polymerase sigma factor RpoD/SigA [Pedosphaera sp.]